MKWICPCNKIKSYQACCKVFHDGKPAPNASLLMRSRYSAYALCLSDYIIQTTHPNNPFYKVDLLKWRQELDDFSKKTIFKKLEIVEYIKGLEDAYVTFLAHLEQNGLEHKQFEKSHFKKHEGRWLYFRYIA